MTRKLNISKNDAQAIVEYNNKVFLRYVRSVRKLSWKDASRKRRIGHESLFETLVHVLNVQEVWLVYIINGKNSDEELGALFNDVRRKPKNWKDFDAYSKRVWEEIHASVGALTTRRMGRVVKVWWMPGRYTVRDGVFQATLEEAHHLGEIIGALWQDDIEPPKMTWMDVRRERPAGGR